MHAHHRDTLKAELAKPEYAGLSADEAFAKLGPGPRVQYMTAAQIARRYARNPKRMPANVIIVGEVVAAQFPTGIPGFPHKIRREEFDAAWNGSV